MRIKWFSFIRVTGLVLVLLYHFFKAQFPGGFLGVDVFFVFSGYLITGLLIDEYAEHEAIDYLAFLRRRFYRIFPPLLLMVLVALPFSLLVRQDFVAGIRTQTAAALGFVTNFYEMMTGGNYESQFIPHLFLHTWSLAIEFQFYVLWALWAKWVAKQSQSLSQFRRWLTLISLGLFLGSFLAMFIGSFFVQNLSQLYFSSLTHAFPFFVGTALAGLTGVKTVTSKLSQQMAQVDWKKALLFLLGGALGLLLLMFTMKFDYRLTYRLGFLLSSLLALLMILGARLLHEQTLNIKEPVFITFLSDISYGIYLFHWPLYVIFSQRMTNSWAVLATLGLSLIFAAFSFYLVEPLLLGRPLDVFGVKLGLKDLKGPLLVLTLPLSLVTIAVLGLAPVLGPFEADLMTQGLKQSGTTMQQTRLAAEHANASDYNVREGVSIMGDSVTLRASDWLSEAIPEAQIDAAVSRHIETLLEVYQKQRDHHLLLQNVVVAVGANVHNNYEALTQTLVDSLPKGHRLILVVPYSQSDTTGLVAAQAALAYQLAQTHDYIYVADWASVAAMHPEIWLGTDGVHFGGDSAGIAAGAQLYADTIALALAEANQGPVKK